MNFSFKLVGLIYKIFGPTIRAAAGGGSGASIGGSS